MLMKGMKSGKILDISGRADILDLLHERKRGVKNNHKILYLNY